MEKLVAIPDDRLFASAPQTAEVLDMDHRTVLRALEAGQIPGFKVGRVWRVPTAWLREQATLGGATKAPA